MPLHALHGLPDGRTALLTPWSSTLLPPLYSEYDGNRMTLTPSRRMNYLQGLQCPHFTGGPGALGDVAW